MKILIVDDNRLNLQYAKDILQDHKIGCDIILCNSGVEALEVLAKEPVDILLLDIVMPELSGIEVLQRIRESTKYKDLQVIMLTSLNDKNVLKESFELGANDYINKPIEQIEFISRIKAAIKMRKYQVNLNNTLEMLEKQNRKLKEAQFHLVQKEKMAAIGELAAGVAHEINNPLAYVSSNFEILAKYLRKMKDTVIMCGSFAQSPEGVEALKQQVMKANYDFEKLSGIANSQYILDDIDGLISDSREGLDKVSKIVQTLRNFAKSDMEDSVYYNDINQIIEEVLLIMSKDAEGVADIEKQFGDIPLVLCNSGQIARVLLNIITNALQAIKGVHCGNKGLIRISTFNSGNTVNCEIFDNGPGIERNILNRIFDPFFTTRDVGEGIGLGLSISYDIIVNKHKGELVAKSEMNIGTVFTIKLPVGNTEDKI